MYRALLGFFGLLSVAACGDDPSVTGGSGSSGSSGDDPSSATTPAIAVLTRTCGPDTCLTYLNVYDSVDAMKAAGSVDKSASIELPYSQGRTHEGSIYLFSRGEQPEVTRWSIAEDLSASQAETVSFANTGTQVFCEICNVFASDELAFHLDSLGGVLVAWNPATMQIVGRTDIPESVITRDIGGGFSEVLWPRAFGGRAFYTAGWFNVDAATIYDRASLITFDATDPTPEITAIEDDRCGGSWAMAPFEDGSGNVYAMGEWYAGRYQVGVLDPVTTPACLLRVNPGASEFDPDYYVDLLTALDAQAIRGAFAMADGHLLLNILPNDAPPVTAADIMAEPEAYGLREDFRYVVLNVETLEVTPVSLEPAAAGSATPLVIDDRTFIQRYEAASATLYEVRTDGSAEKILEAGSGSDFDMIGRVR